MILEQNEIDEAAKNYVFNKFGKIPHPEVLPMYDSFESGVEFAKSKFEEIATDFLEFVTERYTPGHVKNTDIYGYVWRGNEHYRGKIGLKSGEELFQQFIEERNEQ